MKVLVIGGGAAGMMAAISAAEHGAQVILAEKNEKLGKKLYITGKGRCNLTNACPTEEFFDHVLSNPKFLYSAVYSFDHNAVCRFLESEGLKLKEERGQRVFPVSDKSSDVIRTLDRALRRRNVQVRLHTEIRDLIVQQPPGDCSKTSPDGSPDPSFAGVPSAPVADVPILPSSMDRFLYPAEQGGEYQDPGHRILAVTAKGEKILSDAVIIATGGVSYPSTGSTGDGYRFAQTLGHPIVKPLPSLVPFRVRETWAGELEGLSLRNVRVTMDHFEGFGEMLFTADGVSGPLILSASAVLCKQIAASQEGIPLWIDLKPSLDARQLDERILRDFAEQKNKDFRNSLSGLLPSKMIPVIIRLSKIPEHKKVHEITREERKALVSLLKQFPLTVTGTKGFEQAVITRGGISVREVDPSTLQSRKVPGVYFVGEVLDLDAFTGGFNLQIAWSTGYLAGQSAAEKQT